MALIEDIKFRFRTGNVLMQLIYVNAGIFLAMMIVRVLLHLFMQGHLYGELEKLLAVPASPMQLLARPWTLFTHMFVHAGFLHIIFNMLWLHFGGNIFLTFFDSKKLLSTYVLGSLSGAAVFVLAFNLFPVFSQTAALASAVGASAGVLAILVAAATMAPDYSVRLILIGNVRLKFIAIAAVAMDILLIPNGNAGGHFAHLGGAVFGFLYVTMLRRGTDLTVDVLRPWHWLSERFPRRKKTIKVVHRSNTRSDAAFNEKRVSRQEEVDAILDKIKQSGYDSLSKHEKEVLFQASKEI